MLFWLKRRKKYRNKTSLTACVTGDALHPEKKLLRSMKQADAKPLSGFREMR